MNEIKRYSWINGQWEFSSNGGHVEYNRHLEITAAIEARCKELESVLQGVLHVCATLGTNFGMGDIILICNAKEALSTPTTTEHLRKYVEHKASEMFEVNRGVLGIPIHTKKVIPKTTDIDEVVDDFRKDPDMAILLNEAKKI